MQRSTILLLLALSFAFCKYAQKAPAGTSTQPTSAPMPTTPAPVSGDYASEWKAIDSLDKQGLFKSALESTEALYARAKADRNGPQTIKTLLFRGKYTTMLNEDGFVKAVQILENDEKTAAEPERSVLQSLLGELYATYLQSQGWQIQSRTPLADGEGGDILTWSAEQIERRSLAFYSASVQNEAVLRAVQADYLHAISRPGEADSVGAKPLRPNLFDFLGHRALRHFTDERGYLTEPAYKFYLDQPEAFAPAADFVKFNFQSRDTTSGKWLAIRLCQRLIAAHLSAGDEAALIDAELLRLQFADNNAVLEDKADRYRQALAILHKTHYNHPSDAEIAHKIAWEHLTHAAMPNTDPSLLKQAADECESAISRHPGTYGAKLCEALLFDLRREEIGLETEHIGLPGKPLLVSMTYKNVKKIWAKVVQVPNDPLVFEQVEWENRLAYLNGLPAVQQRTWDIRDAGDYRQHRTEIKLDPLPVGRYFVLVSSSGDFAGTTHPACFTAFVCSGLAVVSFDQNGDQQFAVVNRETGSPIAGVRGEFFESKWDRNVRRNVRNRIAQEISDQNGFFKPDIDTRRGFNVRLSREQDTLWLDEFFNNYRNEPRQPNRETLFFTDRSLYRPGQTVYFKGMLLLRNEKEMPAIIPNTDVTVRFLDANSQEKGRLKLRTNEYGTFNGAFQAPASGLTGQMRIEAEGLNGGAWFNVEEYKRPKFEVVFKPVAGAYRVNDAVSVRGEAKNYAGSVVDGAKVRYRVVRQARFPWWDWWRGSKPFPVESMEIANGETSTASDGSFEIKFTALPDRSIPKKDQPMFDFFVTADVTDITGETRSSETQVSVGYVALNVVFDLTETIEIEALRSISLNTTNSAGQFQAASGVIEITRLVAPRQQFVSRYWENPDVLTLQEAEFRRDFPNYAWNGEDNPEKWGRQDFSRTVKFGTTAAAAKVDLHDGSMSAGYYQVILKTKDAFGEPVEIKKTVRVWEAKNRATQFVEPGGILEKNTCEPGETARFWLGGSEKLRFLYLLGREGKSQPPRWLDVAGVQPVETPVLESDRGGLSVNAFAVRNNRFYQVGPHSVTVPWSNKDLTITYETFRDKLAPGEKEEWRIKISGPKKDKVAAELVAAMYDASLDQFLPHSWQGMHFPSHFHRIHFSGSGFRAANGDTRHNPSGMPQPPGRTYREMDWFGFPLYGGRFPGLLADGAVLMMRSPEVANMEVVAPAASGKARAKKDTIVTFDPETYEDQVKIIDHDSEPEEGPVKRPTPPLQPRRNLNETVFFFPEMRTDAQGNIVLKFTMNEALTRWKFLAFGHTKDLQWALSEKSVVTQKELMVLTNPPRFLREGDVLEFTAKVSNLSQEPVTGTAVLNLFDAASMQPVDGDFGLTQKTVSFSVQPGQSAPVSWRLNVPSGKADGLTWQVFAEGKSFRDGEENTLPVLTNRMLVTETLPITVRGNQTKTVVFDNLKNSGSGSLRTHRYTVEFTSNPAWYAVQALPYLMEFPHECTEQIFSRFYANTLASSVTQKMPGLRRVYDRWKAAGSGAMQSNLSKNQELKTALLEETPWVLDAQSEEQQKQNIALLFDLNRMSDERERTIAILAERQGEGGGWSWFPGGQESWYITQHIVTGFGHLNKLGAFSVDNDQQAAQTLDRAMTFCDGEIRHQYAELERQAQAGKIKLDEDHLDGLAIQYLYARSFFPLDRVDNVTGYYLDQGAKYWLKRGLYEQGMLALALHRHGRPEAAQRIVASLRERAIVKEELGMYWPFDWGMYWYQLPIETQALLVEVFDEVANDRKAVEELRIWLLKNKQTNRWESTKATAEAVYALLLHGDNWLENTKPVQVSLGGKTLKPAEYEAGTGYFKETWKGNEVKPAWSTIKVENPNSNLVWGAAYWQYFEDLDKIASFKKTPLTIVKQLYKEENTPTGPKLTAINDGNTLHPGDKIKVRIEIRVDRAMEFVHLKDMRASGLEPQNVLSGYHWQGGLGYYESTKDLATHFFIDYLPRGTFVLEYPLVVNHRGDFSNGITTLQCMYAPEFSSHSEGVRVKVE
ncbi:MAG: alpha-2-macroglobulin family protein [Saprospiraceae bacterium]